MTQKRYHDYLSAQTAWTDAQQFLGILEPSRYRGFDAFTAPNATTINLSHSNTRALRATNLAGTLSANTGVWLTKQGVVIEEDGSITLTSSNFDNSGGGVTHERVFAIYGEHLHINTVGGASATYGIKSGDTSGNYPTLDFPLKQVLLGYLIIPAGETAQGSGVKLELIRPKGLGNEDVALLDYPNTFTKLQEWAQSDTVIPFSGDVVTIDNLKGNTFRTTPDGYLQFITKKDCKPGTKIVLFNNNASGSYSYIIQNIVGINIDDTEYANGKRAIYLGKGIDAIDVIGTGLVDSWAIKWPGQGIAVFELVDATGTEKQYWHLTFVTSLWEELYNLKNNNSELLLTDIKIGLDEANPPLYDLGSGEHQTNLRFPMWLDPTDIASGDYHYSVPPKSYIGGPDGSSTIWVRVSYVIPLSYLGYTADNELALWLTKNCPLTPTQVQIDASKFKLLGMANNDNNFNKNMTIEGSIVVPITAADKLDLYFSVDGYIHKLNIYTSPQGIYSLTFEVLNKQRP